MIIIFSLKRNILQKFPLKFEIFFCIISIRHCQIPFYYSHSLPNEECISNLVRIQISKCGFQSCCCCYQMSNMVRHAMLVEHVHNFGLRQIVGMILYNSTLHLEKLLSTRILLLNLRSKMLEDPR